MTEAVQLGRLAPRTRPGGRSRSALWVLALVAYLVGTGVLAHSSSYEQGLLLVAAVYSILALSLDLVAGATGLYSLGHAGLFAIGAYGTTILSTHYGWNIFLALPVAVLAVGLVGVVIGALSLRVSGLYFAITTLIFTIIVNVLISDLNITGGYTGLASPPFPNFPDALVIRGLFVGVGRLWCLIDHGDPHLEHPQLGSLPSASSHPRFRALRFLCWGPHIGHPSCHLQPVSCLGWSRRLDLQLPRLHHARSVRLHCRGQHPGHGDPRWDEYPHGPIFGAVFISLFPTVVSMNPLWQEILFGSIFLFVIVFFPEGFVGLLARAGRWLRTKWRPQRGGTTPLTESVQSANGWVPSPTGVAGAKVDATLRGKADGVTAGPQLPRVALEARGITFSYVKGVKALDSVDFVVERGTIHGLIGPNGSGKSTLVNLLSGELSPQQGTISINGERVDHRPAWQRPGLGLMRTFQTAGMVKELTTRDNVGLGLFSQFRFMEARSVVWPMLPSARRDSRRITAVASTSLTAVGLGEPWKSSRLADVPHGIEQLTQLAAACASQPSILVLDEPLAGLSAGEVNEVATIARRLKAQGVTIIVVEHQTRFIFEVCDAVTVLAAGELVKAGSAAEVRSDDRVREVYLGL